jgi:homocysteine S-methyltransferase
MINSVNPFAFAKRIGRPLILDGAIGSLLQQKGFKVDDNVWSTKINYLHPEVVVNIHKDYINAGADIITTNTFRTNISAMSKSGFRSNQEYVKQAVKLAKDAVEKLPVFIAGSNAPAEDCYQVSRKLSKKELKINHYNHIDLLYDNEVHFILNETQSHFDEIKIISHHCAKNKIPFVVSLYITNFSQILSGENVRDVVDFIWEHEPLAIGINCVSFNTFKAVSSHIDLNRPWGFYLNCGSGKPQDKIIKTGVDAKSYSKQVSNYISKTPSFIGACCGSTPEHIKAIRELIDG